MELNRSKFDHMLGYLFKACWSCYRRRNSTILLWADPIQVNNDYRIKDAYTKQKEREIAHHASI